MLKALGRLWVVVTAVLGSLVLIGIGVIILLVSGSEGPDASQPVLNQKIVKNGDENKIAILRLTGPISDAGDASGFGGPPNSISATRVKKILRSLADEDQVKAVVLRINSPGGAVVASDELYREIVELQKKKVVVVSFGDTAASGGYYIAAGANKIVANPSTITGSIGVIAQFPKLSGLYDKLGIEMRTIKSGEFKDIGSESRDLTDAERQILDQIIMTSYDQFVQAIVDGRKMDEAKVRALADGRIYSGKQAKELGLVDELGGLETALQQAAELAKLENPTHVEYSDDNFFQALFGAQANRLSLGASLDDVFPTEFGVFYLWSP